MFENLKTSLANFSTPSRNGNFAGAGKNMICIVSNSRNIKLSRIGYKNLLLFIMRPVRERNLLTINVRSEIGEQIKTCCWNKKKKQSPTHPHARSERRREGGVLTRTQTYKQGGNS